MRKDRLVKVAQHRHARTGKEPLDELKLERGIVLRFIQHHMANLSVRLEALHQLG
ncbi:hypothetical protein D3C73_1412420 [compost metagenome]